PGGKPKAAFLHGSGVSRASLTLTPSLHRKSTVPRSARRRRARVLWHVTSSENGPTTRRRLRPWHPRAEVALRAAEELASWRGRCRRAAGPYAVEGTTLRSFSTASSWWRTEPAPCRPAGRRS